MKFSEPKEKTSISNDLTLVQKRCVKFNPFFSPNADKNRAILYIKLLKSGCPRLKAMHFSSKNICKTDSTKMFDGPKDFRILKVKPDPAFTQNVYSFILLKY